MAINKNSEFEERQVRFARLAKALSHPARIAILEILADQNSCMCGDITEQLPLAQSTVSQHLKVLKDSGIISGKINGISICYDLNQEAVNELKDHISEFTEKLSAKQSAME